MADPGWYPDPQDAGSEVYWDGSAWTPHRRPVAITPPAPPPAPAGPAEPWGSAAQNPAAQPTVEQPTIQRPTIQQPTVPQTAWAQPQPQDYQPTQSIQPVQQSAQPYPPVQAGWQAQPQPWQPTPPARRSRKKPLLLAGGVVVLLVAGLVTWLVWPSSAAPSITWKGKAIASAGDVLSKAESSVASLVDNRHGAKSADTRCYFVQPDEQPSGAKKTDVQDKLLCGPVLFIDGNPQEAYLPVGLTDAGTKGGKQQLTAQSSLSGVDNQAVPDNVKLVRPDKKAAPDGNGGLKLPTPPPADKDVLLAARLGPATTPSSLQNSVIVGRDTGVTLQAAGQVDRYGTGDDARSAPAGEKLIAFQVGSHPGAVSSLGDAKPQLVVSGGTPRDLPDLNGDEWIVAAVPTSGSAVVQLQDGGFTQTLSLPDGKPGGDNLQVTTREHTTAGINKRPNVPVHLARNDGATANVTFHANATSASLDFWIPGHEDKHASAPDKAILSVHLNYTDDADPGETFGFDPQLLRLRLADGTVLRARNVAGKGKIYDVFEVPASFTKGTLQITGSERIGNIKLTVRKAISLPVSFPAG